MLNQPKKAGMIPYVKMPDGNILMLFMVSSDPKFGGAKPMISKGGIDDGEDELSAAIREAKEELGLRESNMIETPWCFFSEFVKLTSSSYDLDLYACQVSSASRKDFDKPCYETKFTVWMTRDRFNEIGRKDHKPIVEKLYERLITQ